MKYVFKISVFAIVLSVLLNGCKSKEDKAAEEKKEAVEDGMTSAEEKADETQQTPKVKLAENGQVKYENLNALGTEGVVLQELPPLY